MIPKFLMWISVWMLVPFFTRAIQKVMHVFEGKVTYFGMLSLTYLRNTQKEYYRWNMSRRKFDI